MASFPQHQDKEATPTPSTIISLRPADLVDQPPGRQGATCRPSPSNTHSFSTGRQPLKVCSIVRCRNHQPTNSRPSNANTPSEVDPVIVPCKRSNNRPLGSRQASSSGSLEMQPHATETADSGSVNVLPPGYSTTAENRSPPDQPPYLHTTFQVPSGARTRHPQAEPREALTVTRPTRSNPPAGRWKVADSCRGD